MRSLLLCLAALTLRAEVRLPHLLSSHMVLQRERPMHFWGWADPGESVVVSMEDRSATVTADSYGKWSLSLPPHAAGGPYSITVKGTNSITLEDVLVGDVWFASGQSNMEMPLRGFPNSAVVKNADAEIRAATQPKLRLLLVKQTPSSYVLSDLNGTWTTCTPETAANFSAVAYFFGREIAARENVPVGLIDSTWGGTPADAWTSFEGFGTDANLAPAFLNWAHMVNAEPDRPLIEAKDKRDDEAAKKANAPKPVHPWHPNPASWAPAALYNGMVAPATDYGIKGVIWYQGETNGEPLRAPLYEHLFQTMITDWRRHWGEGEFPFLFVQLSSFGTKDLWPTVREAQRRTLRLANTGMAVTVDVGDEHNVHPADKETVGARLALAARAIAYGEKIEYSGPMFRQAIANGSSIQAWFDHAEGMSARGGEVTGFEIAGVNRMYVPAEAKIEGSTVTLSSPQVTEPKYVRYGWKDVPAVNLYNSDGLPASPFSSEMLLPTTN